MMSPLWMVVEEMFVHRRLREGELFLGTGIGLDWIGSVRQERDVIKMLVSIQPPRFSSRSRHHDFINRHCDSNSVDRS